MQTCRLTSVFEIWNQIEFEYILEIDIGYPKLGLSHQNFPLVPTNGRVGCKGLKDRQNGILERLG